VVWCCVVLSLFLSAAGSVVPMAPLAVLCCLGVGLPLVLGMGGIVFVWCKRNHGVGGVANPSILFGFPLSIRSLAHGLQVSSMVSLLFLLRSLFCFEGTIGFFIKATGSESADDATEVGKFELVSKLKTDLDRLKLSFEGLFGNPADMPDQAFMAQFSEESFVLWSDVGDHLRPSFESKLYEVR
jgi:hypothetical protein